MSESRVGDTLPSLSLRATGAGGREFAKRPETTRKRHRSPHPKAERLRCRPRATRVSTATRLRPPRRVGLPRTSRRRTSSRRPGAWRKRLGLGQRVCQASPVFSGFARHELLTLLGRTWECMKLWETSQRPLGKRKTKESFSLGLPLSKLHQT